MAAPGLPEKQPNLTVGTFPVRRRFESTARKGAFPIHERGAFPTENRLPYETAGAESFLVAEGRPEVSSSGRRRRFGLP
ncbi:hypothetical protein QFZ24_008321 [Streptomyces phaeochromogenes]|nr:hypothetical protein [Streptomyces phaeochromogenes]